MSLDRMAVYGAVIIVVGVTAGLALIWPPLALIVGSALVGVIMVAAALLLAASKTQRAGDDET